MMQYTSQYDINNTWSDSQESLLKKWYKYAQEFNWKHSRAARSYSYRDKVIGIPTVAILAITGTVIFLNIGMIGQNENNIILLSISGTITIIAAILVAIQNFLGLPELATKHNNSAAKYTGFANSIETELSLPRIERLNGKIFIKQAQKRFSELLEICPTIPGWIDKDYKKYMDRISSVDNNDLDEIIINDTIITPKEIVDVPNNSQEEDREGEEDKDTLQDEIEREVRRIKIRESLSNNNFQERRTIDKFVNYF